MEGKFQKPIWLTTTYRTTKPNMYCICSFVGEKNLLHHCQMLVKRMHLSSPLMQLYSLLLIPDNRACSPLSELSGSVRNAYIICSLLTGSNSLICSQSRWQRWQGWQVRAYLWPYAIGETATINSANNCTAHYRIANNLSANNSIANNIMANNCFANNHIANNVIISPIILSLIIVSLIII